VRLVVVQEIFSFQQQFLHTLENALGFSILLYSF
jgi:hypothetical protein